MALGENGRPPAAVTNANDFDPIETVAEELDSLLDAVGSESMPRSSRSEPTAIPATPYILLV